jgi:hypothetical protein
LAQTHQGTSTAITSPALLGKRTVSGIFLSMIDSEILSETTLRSQLSASSCVLVLP